MQRLWRMTRTSLTSIPFALPLSGRTPALLGIAAACAVVLVWSGWVVLSRWGMQDAFSVWDLALIRFGTAAVAVLPFVLRSRARLVEIATLRMAASALACGMVYVALSFAALRSSPAANAGVVVNGLMPIGTMLVLVLWTARRPRLTELGIGVVLLAANVVLLEESLISIDAFALFATATLSLAFYMVAVRQWALDPHTFFFAVPIVNAVVAFALWALLDGSFLGVPAPAIALQALYQGLLVTLGAVTLLTFAIRTIGPISASTAMAAVPLVIAGMAFAFLDETLSSSHIVALILCTTGILGHAWTNRAKPDGPRKETRP